MICRKLFLILFFAFVGMVCSQDTQQWPVRLSIAALTGYEHTWIESNGDMAYYLEPTSTLSDFRGGFGGMEFTVLLGKYVGVATGFRIEKRGQYVTETQVELVNNPYIHDFSSTALVRYISIPLVLKAGIVTKRLWTHLCTGIIGSEVIEDNIEWRIDGNEATSYAPKVRANNDVRLLFGFETGVRLGASGIFVGGTYESSVSNIMYGVAGKSRSKSLGMNVGYRYFFPGL